MKISLSDVHKYEVISLIDLSWYSHQAKRVFYSQKSAFEHFRKHGNELNACPNKMFDTFWYKWQNPDHIQYSTILDHFAICSLERTIDPGPFIDLVQFKRKSGIVDPIKAVLATFDPTWGAMEGVYRAYSDLTKRQAEFHGSVAADVIRGPSDVGARKRRKFLLWVQIGPNSEFAKWFKPGAPREWDLLANWYTPDEVDPNLGEYSFVQTGTKFTSVFNVWRKYQNTFAGYDGVLLLDDDIVFEHKDIDDIFHQSQEYNLDIFQPALTVNSHSTWEIFKKQKNSKFRRLNGVEIMMPGFSKRTINNVFPLFAYSISGFGLDFLISKASKKRGYTVGILDEVPGFHSKEIDQEAGNYYNFLRRYGINAKTELWYLKEAFSLETEFYQIGS